MQIAPADTCTPNNLKMSGPGLTSKSKQAGLAFGGVTWRMRTAKALNRACPSNALRDMGRCVATKQCGSL